MKTPIEPGHLARATKYTRIYKLDVLGVCEVRCNLFRYEMLWTGETLLFSENKDYPHEFGVAILLSKQT